MNNIEKSIVASAIGHATLRDSSGNLKKTVSWGEIKTSVLDRGVNPKTWMGVRAILQKRINSGHLTRTQDVFVEEYTIAR